MEFINSPAKSKILETFVRNRDRPLGIRKISEFSGTSVSIVWRTVPTFLRYGIIVERKKGRKYKAYELNTKNPLTALIVDLYAAFDKATPTRSKPVEYAEFKRAKSEKLRRLVATMNAFQARRGGRPKPEGELRILAAMAKEAWKRAELSGKVKAKGKGLEVNVD